MVYQFFLYKTNNTGRLDLTNAILKSNFARMPSEGRRIAKELTAFDIEAVTARLESLLGNNAVILVDHPPKGMYQSLYIRVVTSYEKAASVISKVMAVACEFDMVYYDPQTRKCLCPDEYVDKYHINSKRQAKQILADIRKGFDMRKIWKTRHICTIEDWGKDREYYVITLRKPRDESVESIVVRLHNSFLSCLDGKEELLYENKGFTISGDSYSVTFYIEGYKNHANQTWYLQHRDGKVVNELIRRMGYEDMLKWLNAASWYDRMDTLDRLQFDEMRYKYKNVLDRLAASIKLTKRVNKIPCGVSIGPISRPDCQYACKGCDGLRFHAFPGEFRGRKEEMSCLNINEDGILDFFPFVDYLFPHIWDRYYDTSHYPINVLKPAVEQLRKVRWILINNPEHKSLREEYWHGRKEDWAWQSLIERRHEVIELIDLFCDWASDQLDVNSHDNGILVITGP